jgi:rhodanese-related sulfurtransferase
MPLRRISPADANALIEKEGYSYVDVRSVAEFQVGHPKGAYNVPLLDMGPMGMAPNPDFLKVMEQTFPKDGKLVVGCQMGGRSLKAATMLESAGYTNVVEQQAGFNGWRPAGLPVSSEADADHSYAGIIQKLK